MFWKKEPEETELDRAITALELEIRDAVDKTTKEYAKRIKNLERLYLLRSKNAPAGINPDTYLIVGGNLAGILIIVIYEHGHVIASKALNFAGKLR